MLKGGATNTGKKFPREILTLDEVKAILRVTSKRGLCGVRDRAIISVLYRGGLRISEALRLYPRDINLDTGVVNIRRGKGGKQRLVAVDAVTVEMIRSWLDTRRSNGISLRAPLFCTLKGSSMSDTQVRQHLQKLAIKAEVDKRVHPHGLRHTFASELVDEGTDIRVVQEALGHSHLSTTETYVRLINPRAVLSAMQQREWQTE
jgi:integrase/recombinase XerD